MKTILSFGDSNTYGTRAAGGRFKRDERWTGILQKMLGDEYYVIEEGCPGRTTVWDDPIEEGKSGKHYLLPCLVSHNPIDLVIIMLGTNDLKNRFSLSSADVQWGMENLVHKIKNSACGLDEQVPEILLVCPIQIGILTDLSQILIGAEEKCRQLPKLYKQLAEREGIHYLNAGDYASADEADGLHIDKAGHANLAKSLCEKIQSIYEGAPQCP